MGIFFLFAYHYNFHQSITVKIGIAVTMNDMQIRKIYRNIFLKNLLVVVRISLVITCTDRLFILNFLVFVLFGGGGSMLTAFTVNTIEEARGCEGEERGTKEEGSKGEFISEEIGSKPLTAMHPG